MFTCISKAFNGRLYQKFGMLKGGGHAKIISIFFISIDSLSDILYDVYVCCMRGDTSGENCTKSRVIVVFFVHETTFTLMSLRALHG